VATDFGRAAPDGLVRDATFPGVTPPITGHGAGDGMFLVDPVAFGHPDLQDVAATAGWLAAEVGRREGPPWPVAVASLPLLIPAPALASAGVAGASGASGASGGSGGSGGFGVAGGSGGSGVAGASGGSGGSGVAGGSGGSGGSIRQFAVDLLTALGDPVTGTNVDALVAWAAGEGSCARFNPLDTTQPKPGATPFNTLPGGGHVWNYPSAAVGLAATVETLQNGLYRPILAVLNSGAGVGALEQAVRSSQWGTGRFGSTQYTGRPCGWSGGPGPAAEAIADAIVARAGLYEALAATLPASAATSPAGAAGGPWGLDGAPTGPAPGPGGHVLPVDRVWFDQHPDWFQRPHHDYPAVDIPVPAGSAVYAVTAGTIVGADEAAGTTSCGHDVRLRDTSGVIFTYCHGSRVAVTTGEHVVAGQLVMSSGWSGAVVPAGPVGAHLHFQINVPGVSSTSCPQPALAAWAAGQEFDLRGLPTIGCVSGHLP
jgi:hypothetical protein